MALNVNLELTDLCNIKCRMCGQAYTNKVHSNPESFMKWDVWVALLDGLRDYGEEIHLCPHWLGEPTLHPRFDEFVRYAFERNAGNRLFRHFKLHTNGVLLDDRRIDTLLDCANRADAAPDTFRFLHFSVDAFTPAVYRQVKRFDHGARVFRNLGRFVERRMERGLRYPYVTIAFIVMPENAHEAGWFLDYWRARFGRLGIDLVVSYDWPQEVADTLYFRRLHQEDQATADRLHREVLERLRILAPGEPGAFISESF